MNSAALVRVFLGRLLGAGAATLTFAVVLAFAVVAGRLAAALAFAVVFAFAVGLFLIRLGDLHDLGAGVGGGACGGAGRKSTGVQPGQSGAGEEGFRRVFHLRYTFVICGRRAR